MELLEGPFTQKYKNKFNVTLMVRNHADKFDFILSSFSKTHAFIPFMNILAVF